MSNAKKILELVFVLLALVTLTSPAYADAKHAATKAKPGASTPAADAPAAPDDAAHGTEPSAKVEEHRGPITMRAGVDVEKLSKFELGPGSYTTEFLVTFHCDREPCTPDFDVTNGKITGKEKLVDEKLVKAFRVKAELDAIVDLSEFPFDKHVLYIGLADKGDPMNVKYAVDANTSSVDAAVKLAGWEVGAELVTSTQTHKLDEQNEVQEALYGVAIARPRVAAVFKTLVPVFFMIFVAGFTLLLKPKSAGGRLSAATGGLMTVVMFHLSSTSSLPPLGYLTRMDKFMIATYLVYVVNIALAVAIVRLDEKKNEKMAELAYLVAGGAVPGVALVAWLTVFLKIA